MAARIIAVAQQKGGAGKTTIATHLAVAWADGGRRVGLIDTDPQRSLGMWYGLRRERRADGDGSAFETAESWKLHTAVDTETAAGRRVRSGRSAASCGASGRRWPEAA